MGLNGRFYKTKFVGRSVFVGADHIFGPKIRAPCASELDRLEELFFVPFRSRTCQLFVPFRSVPFRWSLIGDEYTVSHRYLDMSTLLKACFGARFRSKLALKAYLHVGPISH